MNIEAKYKPWVCCVDQNSLGIRYALQCLQLVAIGEPDKQGKRAGTLQAANGFVIVVVPCELEADDVEGLIDRRVFEWAAKITPPKKTKFDAGRLEFYVGESTVRLANGFVLPKNSDKAAVATKLDDVLKSVTRWPKEANDHRQGSDPFSIDQEMLAKACRGIGTSHVRLTSLGVTSVILVEPIYSMFPVPPYGVFMPMHGGDIQKARKRFPKPEEKQATDKEPTK